MRKRRKLTCQITCVLFFCFDHAIGFCLNSLYLSWLWGFLLLWVLWSTILEHDRDNLQVAIEPITINDSLSSSSYLVVQIPDKMRITLIHCVLFIAWLLLPASVLAERFCGTISNTTMYDPDKLDSLLGNANMLKVFFRRPWPLMWCSSSARNRDT